MFKYATQEHLSICLTKFEDHQNLEVIFPQTKRILISLTLIELVDAPNPEWLDYVP